MFKQTPKKRVLFVHRFTPVLLACFGVFSMVTANLQSSGTAFATTSNTVNFQARLQSSTGAIVPDGTYNVEFKLYDSSVTSGSSQGSCTGDSHCLWTETRTSGNRVTVTNGYLSVSLGSVTALPTTIDWSQQLWLTMNIGGTGGSASWDGEMAPRLQLTAVPYAFQAAQAAQATQLSATNSNGTAGLTFQGAGSGHGNQNFVIQDQGAAGTYNLLTNASGVQLQSSTPGTAQTGNFNISGTGIATTLQAGTFDSTSGALSIGTTHATSINIGSGSTTALTITPATTINNTLVVDPGAGASNPALQIGTSANSNIILTVDTTNSRVSIGSTTTCAGGLGNGRLCVNQSATAASNTNINNVLNIVNAGSAGSNYGQRIAINDTSSSKADTNTGLVIDLTGSNSSTSVNNGIYVNDPSGLGGGNLIQLQTGSSDVFKVTNAGTVSLGNTGGSSSVTVSSGSGGTTLQSDGPVKVKSTTDSTTAFQIQDHTGSSNLLIADTTHTRIGIGMTGPAYTLDVAGDINTSGVYRVGGTAVGQTTSTGCTGGQVLTNITVTGGIITSLGSCATNGGGISPTLQDGYNNSGPNTPTPQIVLTNGNGGVIIKDAGSSTITNLFQIQNSSSTPVFSVTASGVSAATFTASSGFAVGASSGATASACSTGQFVQGQAVTGGIVTTAGSCAYAVTAVGSIDGGSYSANGASIVGTTMYLQTASATQVGLVNTGSQTFAGAKTLTGDTLVKNTSSSAFTVTDGSSVALLTANTSTGTITLGSVASGNYITFTAAAGLVATGTAQHVKTVSLPAEYAGAVLDSASDGSCSANNGTMTSGYDSTNRNNYYDWTSSVASAQCYDVVAQIPIPSDFNGWASSNPLSIKLKKDSTGTAAYAIKIVDSTGTTDSNYNYSSPGTISTSWSNMATSAFGNTSGTNGTTSYVPGDYFTVKIRMSSTSAANVFLGNITLNYNSKF